MGSIKRLSVAIAAAGAGAALSLASATAQERPAFEFRDHTIGQDAKATFTRRWACGRAEPLAISRCADADYKVGKIIVDHIDYLIFDGKVAGLDLTLDAVDWPTFREMLIGKYGPPASEEQATVQNRLGANFDNTTTIWAFKEGFLTLSQRSSLLTQAKLYFLSADVAAQVNAASIQRDREAGRKAF